ncbi:MAG: tetratricopeptide repeat protein [Rhizobiaceae bacterium]
MLTKHRTNTIGNRVLMTSAAIAIAVSLSACANKGLTTGSISRSGPSSAAVDQMSASELASAASTLGQAYAKDPKDKATGLRYAAVLQMNGRSDQSLAVMRKLAIIHPKDREVLAAYGKALAGAGQLEPALDAVRRAQTPEYPDWKLLSAEAAILDQLGQAQPARDLYRKALDLKPNEPSVLSNLGMSYLLAGDLKTAETYMQSAAEQPGADSRVRQNLALVVGLQGRFQEAEKIASHELSPAQAEANVAYLRSMLSQQNAWQQIKEEDGAQETNTN